MMGLEDEFERIDYEIKTKGFSQIEGRIPRRDVVVAAESFLGFLTLPETEKKKFSVPRTVEGGVDQGYIPRKKCENNYDDKEFFHYTPFMEQYRDRVQDSRAGIFFEQAHSIHSRAHAVLDELLNCIDKRHPQFKEKFVLNGESRCFLRFLSYPPKEGEAAAGHYDKGAITLALAESTPGLRIEDTPVRNTNHGTIIMPGYTLPGLAPELGWDKSWHCAEYDQEGPKNGRWAIVFFSNDLKQPPIKGTHDRVPRKHF